MIRVPVGEKLSDAIDWLLDTAPWLFDGISSFMQALVDGLTSALTGPPSWVWIAVFTVAALAARGVGLAVYTVLAFLLVLSMELWEETMQTLALVLVAAALATLIAIPLGVLAARQRAVSLVVRPVLDFAQTTPVFVYLIPAVFFFGVGGGARRRGHDDLRDRPGRTADRAGHPPGRPRDGRGGARLRCAAAGRSCARCSCRWPCPRSWPASTR